MTGTDTIRGTGRLVVATVVFALATACASRPAETPDSSRGSVASGRGRNQSMLFEGITLSAGQQVTVDSIRAAFRSRSGGSEGGDRSQMRQAMEEQRAAIRNVLSSDQQRIFDANVQRMQQERGRGGRGRRSS